MRSLVARRPRRKLPTFRRQPLTRTPHRPRQASWTTSLRLRRTDAAGVTGGAAAGVLAGAAAGAAGAAGTAATAVGLGTVAGATAMAMVGGAGRATAGAAT